MEIVSYNFIKNKREREKKKKKRKNKKRKRKSLSLRGDILFRHYPWVYPKNVVCCNHSVPCIIEALFYQPL